MRSFEGRGSSSEAHPCPRKREYSKMDENVENCEPYLAPYVSVLCTLITHTTHTSVQTPFVSCTRRLVGVGSSLQANVGDGYDDIVVHALQKHLTLKVDNAAFLGALQCPHQCFVVLLYLGIVEQFTKLDCR